MLDPTNILEEIKKDNHNIYQKLLTQLSIHSDLNSELLDAVDDIHIQINNLTMLIEYLLSKGEKNE